MAIGSFSAGLSGLSANSVYLNVIGNNLANINTIAFKSSAVTFQELVNQSISGGGSDVRQIGLGVTTGSISPVFSQGSIENTREATNAAIQGNGFFVVRNDNTGGIAYSRAGNFTLDQAGWLVTPDGWRVQGYSATDPVTGEIITTGPPTDVAVPPGVLREPIPTTLVNTTTNLDATAAVGDTFTASVQIFDSLGSPHVLTITYTNTASGAWNYAITVPGADVNPPPAAGAPAPVAAGSLTFGPLGTIATITPTAPSTGGGAAVPGPLADVQFTAPVWANGAQSAVITWNIVDANNVVSLTGYSSASATLSQSQNGSAAGVVDNLSILSDGSIVATFGAGRTITIAKLALSTFNNPKGLAKLGGNRYSETEVAGSPNVGTAGTGGRGTLIGSALEQSNVDIAQEFTQMILAQRGYQASSKTITVSDEILVDTLNLKR